MRAVIEAIQQRPDARYALPEPPPNEELRPEPLRKLELVQLGDVFGELSLFEGDAEWRVRAPERKY